MVAGGDHKLYATEEKPRARLRGDPQTTTYCTMIQSAAEEDALTQARCAFILRHGHYDDGRVIQWTPEGITKPTL